MNPQRDSAPEVGAVSARAAIKAIEPALQRIGRAAVAALYDELALEPKPGLVSLADNGSHRDMEQLVRSAPRVFQSRRTRCCRR